MTQTDTVGSKTTWLLSGQTGENEPVRQVRVDQSPFTVGRRSDVSLQLLSPTVSGLHAEFVVEEGRLLVRDLGSTNGTFLNGVRITEACIVNHGDLVQFSHIVFRAKLKTEASESHTIQNDVADRALALIQFDKLLTERAVTPHFQPIVELDGPKTVGYEVLGRSPIFGLSEPHAMFTAAAVLNLESELSRILRIEGARAGQVLDPRAAIFVNTHPAEIQELGLLEFSLRELRELEPERPIVLEIHESTVSPTSQLRELKSAMADMNIEIAYDDFGAGQARLVELVEVRADYLKFDIKVVQGIGQASPERQRMLEHLVNMTLELGIKPLAEGIETEEDHHVCRQIGFQFAQGYLYGRPALPKSLDFNAPIGPLNLADGSVPV